VAWTFRLPNDPALYPGEDPPAWPAGLRAKFDNAVNAGTTVEIVTTVRPLDLADPATVFLWLAATVDGVVFYDAIPAVDDRPAEP
jgi:hypothetical protein